MIPLYIIRCTHEVTDVQMYPTNAFHGVLGYFILARRRFVCPTVVMVPIRRPNVRRKALLSGVNSGYRRVDIASNIRFLTK